MKKILLSSLTCLLAIGLVCACDENADKTYAGNRGRLTIWCPSKLLNSTQQLVREFSEQYPEFTDLYRVHIEVQEAGEAYENVIADTASAADIYFIQNNALDCLVQVDGLSAVPSSSVEEVTARNDSISIKAASIGDTLYAYPLTSDNGYFVYYDKGVIGLDEEMTREGGARQSELIKIAKENSKTIDFEIANSGRYLASYFIGAGCESTWTTDVDWNIINYKDTWNSPAGLSALQGAAELMGSGVFNDDESAGSAFRNNAILVVSGTWDYTNAKNILGDNLGAAPLWTFDITGDGENSVEEGETETFHLGSFSINYSMCVKPQESEDKSTWCHLLANYLSDEYAQIMYYNKANWGPSNLAAQASEPVQSDEALQTLYAQNEYAVPQGQYPNDWWVITVTLGSKTAALGSSYTNDDLLNLLEEYDASIKSIIG